MRKIKILLFVVLLILLGNMPAPFSIGSFSTLPIPISKVPLKMEREEVTLKLSPQEVKGSVIYDILNPYKEVEVGFVFPLLGEGMYYSKKDLHVYFNNKPIDSELMTLSQLREALGDKFTKFEKTISPSDRVFIDPLKDTPYKSKYLDLHNLSEERHSFFFFKIHFKENEKGILRVEFRDFPGFDRKLYPKEIYHYYYIVNVKDYYNEFKNITINIIYPKDYVVSTRPDGEEESMDGFKKRSIFIEKPENNLSISYMEDRPSSLSIYLYRKFPFLYSSYFWFFLFIILFFAAIITTISLLWLKLLKNRRSP